MAHWLFVAFFNKKLFFIGEPIMPTDEEILKRDKEILTHIQHRYDEEERRFQTVDSKISSMIAVLIMIFTIQGSLFTNILSNMDKLNISLMILFIISLVL